MRLYAVIHSVLLLTHAAKNTEDSDNCKLKETCGECIAEGPSCGWCTQESYTEDDIPRCAHVSSLTAQCDTASTYNPSNSFTILKDKKLSDKGAKEEDAIQIKPQEIRLKLRPKKPETFKIEFRQAVDYPVDLYYVMDLSFSMADDQVKLAELGDKLALEMGTITSNFRLGFGSFVDKVAAPYVNMHPEKLKQPCSGYICDPPYGFRNNMPLSLNTGEFARKVRGSPISGNLDGIEGGFDAMMQAIVCKKEIGWRNKSRKLLVLSTDNGSHSAGDGKLAGIVDPNDESCHLDNDGYYTMTAKLDYPSISQLNHQIKENKVNVIFAVTEDQVEMYSKYSKRLIGSTTGKLEGDSSNVVNLIKDQYNELSSSVELIDSLRDSSNIRISYESQCLGNKTQETNICGGLKVGTTVSFDAKVEAVSCPSDPADWKQTFHIFPVGLDEHITVHLEIHCECDCEKPENEVRFSNKCNNGNGTFECGMCSCNQYMYGKTCECDSRISDPFAEESACFNVNDTQVCSGRGYCRCGQCRCKEPSGKGEKIYSTYCECDNYSCDKKDGLFCSGPDHGTCDCGKCKCKPGYDGSDCSCSTDVEACMGTNGKICSGHGECDCGACACDKGENYFGKLCDDCLTCPGKCDELRPCVECFIEDLQGDHVSQMGNCSACNLTIYAVDDLQVEEELEKSCAFQDEQDCRFSFKYKAVEQGQPTVFVKKSKECPTPVDTFAIIASVIGSVVGAGLLLLIMWKLLTTVHDRREFAKFEKERQQAKWDSAENPIYKQASSTFANPVYEASADDSKQLN